MYELKKVLLTYLRMVSEIKAKKSQKNIFFAKTNNNICILQVILLCKMHKSETVAA